MKPPDPDAEAQRLARLHELMVLDTEAEPLFEHLVQWASQTCGAPIALVSLVDENRQWFKAETGLPGVRETPRELAFCAHAIHDDGVFEVPDATADARFRDNPLVTGEPGIRFYAGAPLTLPGGERIGTLCVIDRQPRTLTPEQAQTLQQLARTATEALLMRSSLIQRTLAARSDYEEALRSSRSFLQRTGRVAGVGGWQMELATEQVTWSDETRRLHEVPPGYQPTLAGALGFYAPESRPLIEAAVQHAIASGQGWDLQLAIVTAQGQQRWVRAVGEVEFEGGRAVRLVGAVQDITGRKVLEDRIAANERFVREITDNLAVRIAYVDRALRHRFVNQAYCQRWGLAREQILGRTRTELLGRADEPEVAARVAAVLAGTPQHFEFEEVVDGRRLRIESRLRPDIDADGRVQGFFATGIDVTERSRNEDALRALTAIIEQSTDFILRSSPRGELLYMNPAARQVTGIAPDAPLAGRLATEFNTPETNQLLQDVLLPAVKRDGLWRGETVVAAADGRLLPVSHLVMAHHDAEGRLQHYSSVLRDISHEVQQRQELQRQSATLRSVTDALPVIVSAVDAQMRYRFVNQAFEEWHGLRAEQVLGRSALEMLAPADIERSLPWAQRALAGESVHFERHYPERPGQPTLSLSYIPVRLADGSTDGFVGVGFDITPHRQEQVRLQSLAERDALTGLLNRAGFLATLQRALLAGRGPELALLYIDLDRFKPVNDSHGHATGDALLQAFAQRLVRLVRPTDAIARLGGDEFAVLLIGVREAAAAEAVAAKVVDAAGETFVLGALRLHIGASVGVALGTGSGDGGAELMARADAQLYRAKQGGRGRLAGERPGDRPGGCPDDGPRDGTA